MIAIVLVRYRALIPLVFMFLIVESFFRIVSGTLHPLTPEHYETRPPGAYATYIFLVYSVVMLWLSLRERENKPLQDAAEDG